ncbi:MAG: LCCL domain-containing protein [Defluviitaleaceae bacterium]|nr:LCCL domain-containing protein [Defluviitaleaceae bacterium]
MLAFTLAACGIGGIGDKSTPPPANNNPTNTPEGNKPSGGNDIPQNNLPLTLQIIDSTSGIFRIHYPALPRDFRSSNENITDYYYCDVQIYGGGTYNYTLAVHLINGPLTFTQFGFHRHDPNSGENIDTLSSAGFQADGKNVYFQFMIPDEFDFDSVHRVRYRIEHITEHRVGSETSFTSEIIVDESVQIKDILVSNIGIDISLPTPGIDSDIPNNGTPPNVSATMESHRGDKAYFFTTSGDYIVFVRKMYATHSYDGAFFEVESFLIQKLAELGLEATFYTITNYVNEGRPDISAVFKKLVFDNETDAETFLQSLIGGDLNKKDLYARVDNVVYLNARPQGDMVFVGSDWDIASFYKDNAIAALGRGGWSSGNEINYNVIDYYISDTSVLLPPPSIFVQSSPTPTPSPSPLPTSSPSPSPSPPAVNQDSYFGNATHLRGENNALHTFYVVGSSDSSVWGSDVYTDDSSIATAAVHAGLLKVGEGGTVTIRILPGLESYEGTTRNGITTFSYGSWGGSYEFVR